MALTLSYIEAWIRKNLAEHSLKITVKELRSVIAETIKDMQIELNLDDNMSTATMVYGYSAGYGTLPVDCISVSKIIRETSDGDEYYDLIAHKDFQTRKFYNDRGINYFYNIGGKAYISWTATADITFIVHYYPYFTGEAVDPASDLLGIATTLPASVSRALRYGVLSDLMKVYAKTELDAFRAKQWKAEYYDLLDRARPALRRKMPNDRNRRELNV